MSFSSTDSTVEWEVTLGAVGGHRKGRRARDPEVNAALGIAELEVGGIWVERPEVQAPEDYTPRFLPALFRDTINETVELDLISLD